MDTQETTVALTLTELRRASTIVNQIATERASTGSSSLDQTIKDMLESKDPNEVRLGFGLCGEGRMRLTPKGQEHLAILEQARTLEHLDFEVGGDTSRDPMEPASISPHPTDPPIEVVDEVRAEPTERELRIEQVNQLLATLMGGDRRAIARHLDRYGRGRLTVFEANLENMFDHVLDRLFGDLMELQAQQDRLVADRAAMQVLVREIEAMVLIDGRDYTEWWSRRLGKKQVDTLKGRASDQASLDQLDQLVRVMRRKLPELKEARAAYAAQRAEPREARRAHKGNAAATRKPGPAPIIHLSDEEQRRLMGNRPNAQPAHRTRSSDVRVGGKSERGKKGKPSGRKGRK